MLILFVVFVLNVDKINISNFVCLFVWLLGFKC